MSSVALPSSQSHWRLLAAGVLLPAVFVAIDRVLLDCVAGLWRTDWSVTLTMAMFIVQIGLMGVICGHWIDLQLMRWVLYAWCWILIDFQAIVAWVFTDATSWWGSSFQPASLFAAQLGLLTIWAVLGSARWTTRLPVAMVVGGTLFLFLSRVRYEYENAIALILIQVAMLVGICVLLRRKGFRVAVVQPGDRSLPSLTAFDLRVSQFGLRDVLIWMTALALVCGLIRWIGIPWDQWFGIHYRSWIPLFACGTALSVTLVIAMRAALGLETSPGRRYLPLLLIPVLAITAAFVGWLASLLTWQPWTSPWYGTASWWTRFVWVFWSPFSESSQFITAWLCLSGGMLFAALLFPRALGYRLVKQHEQGTVH
ncbi:MAG TPA: hypothetical protein VGI40_28440 [Pirellulaceae bacterium]|jgi:hypothetical protein